MTRRRIWKLSEGLEGKVELPIWQRARPHKSARRLPTLCVYPRSFLQQRCHRTKKRQFIPAVPPVITVEEVDGFLARWTTLSGIPPSSLSPSSLFAHIEVGISNNSHEEEIHEGKKIPEWRARMQANLDGERWR